MSIDSNGDQSSAVCPSCGSANIGMARVRSAFWHDDRLVVVEDIPALVCAAATSSSTTTSTVVVLDLLRGEGFPAEKARERNARAGVLVPRQPDGRGGDMIAAGHARAASDRREPHCHRRLAGDGPGGRRLHAQGRQDAVARTDGHAARPRNLREIGNRSRTEAEWREFLAERHKQLSEREVSELAAYLAVNMPLPEGAVQQAKARRPRLGAAAGRTRARLDAVPVLPLAVRRLPDAAARRAGLAQHLPVAVPSRAEDDRAGARDLRALFGHQHADEDRRRAGRPALLRIACANRWSDGTQGMGDRP